MSKELFWLALTLGMTALFMFSYVLNRMAIRGLIGTMGNPSANDKPLAEWAQRAQRAHTNAVENLVLFAPAAIAVHVASLGNSLTATACALYFFSRLVHFVAYTFGIPGIRTLAFFSGWGAIAILVLRLLGVL